MKEQRQQGRIREILRVAEKEGSKSREREGREAERIGRGAENEGRKSRERRKGS